MEALTAPPNRKFIKTRRLIIAVFCIFLIVYHISKLLNIYTAASGAEYALIVHMQSLLRMAIIVTATLVIFGKKYALTSMWISITALITTQYIVYFGLVQADMTPVSSAVSYLRGFILPTIITLIFPFQSKIASSLHPS